MIKKLLLLVLVYFSATSTSVGQEVNRLSFQEISSGGVRTGCNLIFQATGQDYSSKQGKSVIIRGSFGYFEKFWTFKLETGELLKWLEYAKDNKVNLVKSDPINYAYFKPINCFIDSKADCKSSAKQEVKSFKSEGGGFFGVYAFNNKSAREVNLGLSNVEVGFNRRKKGFDIKFLLDFNTEDNRPEVEKYGKCIIEMIDD